MKKLLKPLLVIAIAGLSLSINIDKNVLANDIASTCGYDSSSKVNPDYKTMNCLLTETALSYDVPPEIVKAIAENESGNWRHFDQNGEAIVTVDNGIGIMQITNQAGYDQQILKNDIVENIKAGVQILDKMFTRNDLPIINGGQKERDVLENWYFAIMAYNGTKPVNSPIVQATGERNAKAYQEKILKILKERELINLAKLNFKREDFQYDPKSGENIKFTKMNYSLDDFDGPITRSKHHFKTNQVVIATTNNVSIRPRPSTSKSATKTLSAGEAVTITGPFVYDEVSTTNHFVWYPVKNKDGIEGYVASSYLDYSVSNPTPTPTTPVNTKPDYSVYAKKFADFKDLWWTENMIWAIERGLINGVPVWNAKTKKTETQLQPNAELTEAQFLTIFFRFAHNEELATVENTTSWKYSGLYNMAKKYQMPVKASEASNFKGYADKGIERGKIAELIASYHFKKNVNEKDAIQFFMDNGITTEKTIAKYEPRRILKRSEISAFIQRYESFVLNQK